MATLGTGSGGLATNGLDIVDGEGVSGSSTAYSLTSVDTESPAGSAPQTVAFPVGWTASQGGLTAQADNTRANATELNYGSNELSVVAGAADSAVLPPAIQGAVVYVANAGAAAAQIFAAGSDTLNGTAGATGVSQTNGLNATYFCPTTGKWYRVLSA